MLDVMNAAEVGWQGAAGKSVASLTKVACSELTKTTPHTYECDLGTDDLSGAKLASLTGPNAKLLVDNLVARKIVGKKAADRTVYEVASIRCTSRNEPMQDGRYEPDSCTAEK